MPEHFIFTLHDAADRLRHLEADLLGVLDQARPAENGHHAREAALGPAPGQYPDYATYVALGLETGWRHYYDAADRIIDLLSAVDQRCSDAHVAHYFEHEGEVGR